MNAIPTQRKNFAFGNLTSLLVAFMMVLCATFSQGQPLQTLLSPFNTFMNSQVESSDPEGMLYFKPSNDLGAGDLFTTHKQHTGLATDDAMTLLSSEMDAEGYVHNQYQQYYKNLKVEGGEMFEHLKNCKLLAVNGRLVEGLNLSAQPAYNEQQALAAALNSIGATEYAWEDPEMEEDLQEMTGDSNATYYPTGQLMLAYEQGSSMNASNFKLSWLFEIVATQPVSVKIVYIDAQNGAVLKAFDNMEYNGPCTTLFDGAQTLDTKWAGGVGHGHHHMVGDDNDKDVETRNGALFPWKKKGHLFDLDDVWASDRMAESQVHWGVCRTWDFFKETYGRTSMDNKNCSVRAIAISSDPLLVNRAAHAQVDGQHFIACGVSSGLSGPSGTNVSSLDIVGHEFTHGVVQHEANFASGFGEPDALNESFCDIFGTMTERFARNGTSNFTSGEDVGGIVFRSLQTPALSAFPGSATYIIDPLWCTVVGPTCFSHMNGGVQNRWFYLLSAGGSQNGVNVQGIGMDKAAKIAYYNLCHYLGSTSGFPAARIGAIAAARYLYGECSNELIQTTNAWAAVGVGTPFSGSCVAIDGIDLICIHNIATYTYFASGLPGADFTWSYPSDWTASTSGSDNGQLTVTSIPAYSTYPVVRTISVTSSLGGTAGIEIELYNNCELIVCEDEDRNMIHGNPRSSLEDVTVRPNPAKDKIMVAASEGQIQKVSIYSLTGVLLIEYNNRTKGNEFWVDISQIKAGAYSISVQLENKYVVKRFVKID